MYVYKQYLQYLHAPNNERAYAYPYECTNNKQDILPRMFQQSSNQT